MDHVAEWRMAADDIITDDGQQIEKPCSDEHADGGALLFGDAEEEGKTVAEGGGCGQNDEGCFVKHLVSPPCGIVRTSRGWRRRR